MKNAKNKTVLGLMILAAIVSGCTGGGGTEEDEGSTSLTVNEFSAFPNPVPGGQNVQLRTQLVNDGDHDVNSAFARIYNPPFGSGSQVFSNTSGGAPTDSYLTLEFDSLRAEGDQTPAIAKTSQQTFRAPELSRGRNIGYGFKSDIFFKYETTGTAEVRIMGAEAYRDAGSPQGSAGLENSRGPIQLEVRTPTPIRVFESGNSDITKSFCVIARNQGQGTPFDPGVNLDGGDIDRSLIQEQEDEVEIGVQDVGQVTFEPQQGDGEVVDKQIYNGKASACFDMTVSSVSPTTETTIPVRVEADYGYKKTANSQLRVEGRGESTEIGENGGGTTGGETSINGVEDPYPDTTYEYNDNNDVADTVANYFQSYRDWPDGENVGSYDITPNNPPEEQDIVCGLLQDYNEAKSDEFTDQQFSSACNTVN